jgi:hypothetical protein
MASLFVGIDSYLLRNNCFEWHEQTIVSHSPIGLYKFENLLQQIQKQMTFALYDCQDKYYAI